MTSEEHNKYLGWAHLAHGGFYGLFMILMAAMFFFVMMMAEGERGAPPWPLFALMGVFMLFFTALYAIPSFIAGYGLLKRKPWAKTWGIISGVIAAMNFPIGTAVCVYSVWFLLGEKGKDFYNRPHERFSGKQSFPRPRSSFGETAADEWQLNRERERERVYEPPPKMPDWREGE